MWKLFFVVVVLLALSGHVTAQKQTPEPAPPTRLEVTFTEPPPTTAPDITGESWVGSEFGQRFHWHAPFSMEDFFQRHVMANGVCASDHLICSATLRSIRMNDRASDQLMLRYVIQDADGSRVEGYAFLEKETKAHRYFRYRNGVWHELLRGSPAAKAENVFVGGVWDYITFWKSFQQFEKKPVPDSGDTVY